MGGFPFGGKLLQARSVGVLLIDDKVEVTGINEAIKDMKKLDAEAVKALRNKMKSAILPTAQKIAAKVPTQAPLSGMIHAGRTRWTGARARVAFTPAKIRKGKDLHPIVSIVLTGKGTGVGFDLAEIAGSRNFQFTRERSKEFQRRTSSNKIRTRQNGQGRQMVGQMESRGRAPWTLRAGRFGFGYFLQEKKNLEQIAKGILADQAEQYNQKIARR
jgi:hypothetical protein